MTIDIREGDLLVDESDSSEYPVSIARAWPLYHLSLEAFQMMATGRFSAKRGEVRSGGVIGKASDATEHVTGLVGLPLLPMTAQDYETVGLDTPADMLQTILMDSDGALHVVVERHKE